MLNIPSAILGFTRQCLKGFKIEEDSNDAIIQCRRDHRFNAINPQTRERGSIVQLKTKPIRDVPLFGGKTWIEVERAQVRGSNNQRHMETLSFTDKGCYYTQRFCKLVSGMCRHMSIKTVSKHLDLRWESVKNIDRFWLKTHLPNLEPEQLKDLTYIGVDEVARAKGHD